MKDPKKLILSVLILALAIAAVVGTVISIQDKGYSSSPAVDTESYEIPSVSETEPTDLPEVDVNTDDKSSDSTDTAANTGPDTKDGDVEKVIIAYPNGAKEEE